VGQFLQFGFSNTSSNYVGSGVFYDNVTFTKTATLLGVGPTSGPSIADMRTAAPNPFSSSTRIDYSLATAGSADLSVYDVTGRRVATLVHGEAGAGLHSATWTGRSTDGRTVPAGVYNAVLQTASGRITHRIVFSH
jgi:flagellar hook assembly protein FlgD